MKWNNILFPLAALLMLTAPSFVSYADDDKEIQMNKSATYDYASQRGEITLESYVPGEIKVVQKAKPLDLVMVLDNSSSMDWDIGGGYGKPRRWQTLVDAMSQFLDKIYDNAVKNNVDHKVSIVIFGGNSYPPTYNGGGSASSTKKVYITPGTDNFLHEVSFGEGTKSNEDCKSSCVIKRFCSIKTEKDNLKSTLADFDPVGANTATSRGFLLAKLMYENFARSKEDAVRTIVFFSDGEPQCYSDKFWGVQTGQSSYTKGNVLEANDALDYANAMKADGVTIFSVYYNHKENVDVLNFMEGLSSNYMTAKANCDATYGVMKSPAWKLGTSYKPKDFSYFINASKSTDDLINAFNTIASKIEVAVDEKYDKYCSMEDYIDNRYFHYPDDATVDDIHVFENALKNYDSATKTYTFKDEMTEITDKVTVKLKLAKDTGKENDEVLVFGYSYSDNWCGIDQSTNTVHGNRLVVKLPFVFKGGTDVNSVPTNTEDSGMYPVEKDEKGDPVIVDDEPKPDREHGKKYNVPKITFCTMKITRENLHRGETAVYKVTQVNTKTGETRFVANVPIGGLDEATPVEKYLYGLPVEENIKFIAEETNWNWAYIKSDPSALKKEAAAVLEDGFYHVDFKFSGKHIEESVPTKAASLKSHDEDFAENRIDLSTLPAGGK